MTFRPGQPVVCVDAKDTELCGDSVLVAGRIYTVAGDGRACSSTLAISRSPWVRSQLIHLVEIVCDPCPDCGGLTPFSAMRFRPIVQRKTDISELQKLCDPTREVVR